ncbi:hypothetical protein ACFOYW_18540 [Gryllotalpicola reticulitermitis]|uniref:Transposase for insertion sequence element IS21-like C-terminal domain-containing protein n=1 Tax=Gryllotalpicola reticulitermitis TaxID=1184153 RepID=A0ABV8QAN8_9MICO
MRLDRDYYMRLAPSDYSVDPHTIGRMVEVAADLERVRVRLEGLVIADHARIWARGMTITDPTHVAAARGLRQRLQQLRPAPGDDLTRDLADYDRAFGLTGEVA